MPRPFTVGRWAVEPDLNTISSNGTSAHLEPKAMEVLVRLAESPGRTLSKEQLIHAVWADTFVGDDVLTRSIYELRKAFGDDSHEPQVIQTIAKRGYRLIAPVKQPEEAKPAWRTLAVVVVVVAAVIGAAGFTLLLWRRAHQPKLTQRDYIVLGEFANRTGEPNLDDTFTQALAVKLSESPLLNVLPEQSVQATLREMKRPPTERMTGNIGLEVCQRVGVGGEDEGAQRQNATALVTGSLVKLGGRYVISLTAQHCASASVLARAQLEAASPDQIITALGRAATELRKKLGETLPAVGRFNVPLEQATTSSIAALKLYEQGVAMIRATGDARKGLPLLLRATELDPEYAAAYRAIARGYDSIGDWKSAAEYASKAFALRDRVTERERLAITGEYYTRTTRELYKARDTYLVWAQSYPRDASPRLLLSRVLQSLGEYEQALPYAEAAVRLSAVPNAPAVANLINVYVVRGRFDEAQSIWRKELSLGRDSPESRLSIFVIAFLTGDKKGMEQHLIALEKLNGEYAHNARSNLAMGAGKVREARRHSREAMKYYLERQVATTPSTAFDILAYLARSDAFIGNLQAASTEAHESLTATLTGKAWAGVALAFSGRTDEAHKLVEAMRRERPLDTIAQNVLVPKVEAAIAIAENRPLQAIELLRVAAPHDYFKREYTYLRGLAFLKAGMADKAVEQFGNLVDSTSEEYRNAPFGLLSPLGQLGLARAYAQMSDLTRAAAAYQQFLELWKGADPDVPVLIEARKELAAVLATKATQVSPPNPG